MAKIKKVFFTVLLFLLTALFCVPFSACGNKQAGRKSATADVNEEVTPYGLYTDLQFSLNGEKGFVSASVKNKFTLFPSTVTVNIELYRSDSFKENVAEMTLAASNYIYDLDQGETITATASTEGKSSYWKAKARYRVDNKAWSENFSETVYFNADGIKTTASASAPEEKQYFVSDFLPSDAESVGIHFYPEHIPFYDPDPNQISGVGADSFFWLENEQEINTVKAMFGEVKLEPFDKESKSDLEKQQFYFSIMVNTFHVCLSDGSTAIISINDRNKDISGVNLFVQYYKHTATEDFSKCFSALISEETEQAVFDAVNTIYRIQRNINAYATEWINFTDLLRGAVMSGKTDLRVKFHRYGDPEKRIKFNIDGSDMISLNNIFSEVKVTPYDMNKEPPFSISLETYFNTSIKYPYYSLSIKFTDGRAVDIYLSTMYTYEISVNLFIICNDGDATRYYGGLMDVEMQEALVELTKEMYDRKQLEYAEKLLESMK
ncbi:MAG: hypothetical protein K2N23_04685 [Clostridia bacterium]|nr:hypothetical protein [Clostridia bacterium]